MKTRTMTRTGALALLVLIATPPAVPADGDAAADLARQAYEAARAGDPASCLRLYRQALEAGRKGTSSPYNAACCAALAGDLESSAELLGMAADRGYRELDHLENDPDLESLRSTPAWAGIIAAVEANLAAYHASIHSELYELYQADQADRRIRDPGPDEWEKIAQRDQQRLERVLELVKAGEPKAADDFFHAAMVLQHGREAENYKMAHELARKAAELDPEHRSAKWLSAAAWDRYLWNTGEPQIYGTQFRRDHGGPWTLEPFDRDAVSDEERRALNVPSLADTLKRLESRNAALEDQER